MLVTSYVQELRVMANSVIGGDIRSTIHVPKISRAGAAPTYLILKEKKGKGRGEEGGKPPVRCGRELRSWAR